MGIMDKFFGNAISEPIFVKEFDMESNIQLNQLKDLLEKVGDDQKSIVENEIKLIQIGLVGEKNVAFELKNSFLPIVCLHDLRLVYRDYSAQFDFIVITNKCVFVLETKSLVGDIIIDNRGNFIRVYKDFKGVVYKKEGMNSPISQNEKHVEILRRFLIENKMDKNVPIASLIVIAKPKSIIDLKFAKKEIKNIVIKHDQIKTKINEICDSMNSYSATYNDKAMLNLANFLLENDEHIEYNYIKKLNLKLNDVVEIKEIVKTEEVKEQFKKEPILDDSLFEKLKDFRFLKSKEKSVPFWFIFNNDQLSNLVLNRPKNKEEFISISGFGEKKYDEFGQDIINIILGTNIEVEKSNDRIVDTQVNIDVNVSLKNALKEYRITKGKAENIALYFIYNNEEMELLCTSKPQTKDEFLTIKGFGEKKFEKYGKDIIEIIKIHNN